MKQMVLAIMIATLSLQLASCSGSKKAELPAAIDPKKQPAQIKDPPSVKPKASGTEYRLLGQVSSQDKMVLTFKVMGTIAKIYVKPGMTVKKGQVLAELDVENYRLRAEAAKLRLEQAANVRAQADRDFVIEEELSQKEISSRTQFQNAQISHRNAVIAEGLAGNDLKTAEKALSDAHLSAPVNGVISAQMKYVGDPATGGQDSGQIFEMFGTAEPEIYLSAPESLLAKLKVDAKLTVSFPAISLSLPAKISRIASVIRESDRTFLVVATLTEHNARVVPGLFAEAQYVSF